MPKTNYNDNDAKLSNNDDIVSYVKEMLNEISDNAVQRACDYSTIVIRNQSDQSSVDKLVKIFNRRTSIVDQEVRHSVGIVEARNDYVNVRRTVSECVIHENDILKDFLEDPRGCDNSETSKPTPKESPKDVKDKSHKEKKKKKLSFNSIFGKKDKHKAKEAKEEEETHDNLAQLPVFRSNTLGKAKKYHSSLELQQKKNELHRKPSFIKKLVHISEDSSNFFKRSMSFRDNKKSEKAREILKEKKAHEWRQSLQSLVETDINVSYNDLSFVNYDALNDINYKSGHLKAGNPEAGSHSIGRTQSMIEKVSENCWFNCFLIVLNDVVCGKTTIIIIKYPDDFLRLE